VQTAKINNVSKKPIPNVNNSFTKKEDRAEQLL